MHDYLSAVRDFRRARRKVAMERVIARLRGRSVDLLAYDQVRQQLKARISGSTGLRDIPLDAIVGSVGRYTDFTRSFLPKRDSDEERWARVQLAITNFGGLPPIEVYQMGEVYFVRDGNHRVSIARQFGAKQIQAYVTEIQTTVQLSPDVQPDELILKAEYADFLARTRLDQIRPNADLSVTNPGRYPAIGEHIEVHRYFMGLEQEREIPNQEAVGHWYDEVYLPVIKTIRQQGLLREFPERTEADLYLWLAEHRAALEEALGWEVGAGEAATDLASQHSPGPMRAVARVGGRVLSAVTPDEFEAGPSPGRWRQERVAIRPDDRLFADILVPVSGQDAGWRALGQALVIAQHEGARLRGLHIVASDAQAVREKARVVQDEFDRRCEEAGVPGKLTVAEGRVARQICERSRWFDLVVAHLAHPPEPQAVAKLGSGFRTLIRRCPRPLLAVPGPVSPLSRALLAYDGSPKGDEALFVTTYLAGRWQIPLTVVTVLEDSRVGKDTLSRAQEYLEAHGASATFVQETGPVADAILRTARESGSDLVLMGGYGHGPVIEVVLGSAVDQVLRQSQVPILICR